MAYQKTAGFTIIEVVLFLAISGVLAISLLIGTGVAVQRQQYKDTIQSFASFLRDQYAKVIAVENDRPHEAACPVEGVGGVVDRGRSDCTIIGRYIQSIASPGGTDGRSYQVQTVFASGTKDAMRYALGDVVSTYDVSWSARTRLASQAEDGATIAMIMYRHPESGMVQIKTTTNQYTTATIGDLFRNESLQQSQELCVYDTGWLVGERQSVFLGQGSGSSDAITVGLATEACKRDA